MHRTYVNARPLLWVHSRGSSSGTSLLGVPRMLFKKTAFAACSRGRRLTVEHTTQPAGVLMTNSSDPSLMPKKMPSKSWSVICIFLLLTYWYKILSLHAEGMVLG